MHATGNNLMSTWYFYYPKRISFYPPDYESPGLGGGEGSLVVLTEALARAGEKVVVWMLDDRTRGVSRFIQLYGASGGKVVIASNAMAEALFKAGISGPVVKLPLLVNLDRYQIRPDKSLSCIYCSVPNRGLDTLLVMWPTIHSEVPAAKLWVTGGYQLWGYTNEEAEDRYRSVVGAADKVAGVQTFGLMSKRDLTILQSSAALMTYPCRFPEMFCLAAAECAAAGTPVVASDSGALSERIMNGKTGYLISGNIARDDTQATFIQTVIGLLRDSARRQQFSEESRVFARAYDADAIAEKWVQVAIQSDYQGLFD